MKLYKRNFVKLFALGAMTAAVLSMGALSVKGDETTGRGQLTAKDYKFVSEAAAGGQMEVDLGQLAVQKASDPAVRDFGQRMVTDHTKANDELKQLASQKGAALPDAATKKNEKMMEKYQNLSGAEFDKAYMKNMVSDHKKDVKAFQKEGEKGDDADLKAWVNKTLPTLQDHLQQAQSVEANVTGVKSTAKAQ